MPFEVTQGLKATSGYLKSQLHSRKITVTLLVMSARTCKYHTACTQMTDELERGHEGTRITTEPVDYHCVRSLVCLITLFLIIKIPIIFIKSYCFIKPSFFSISLFTVVLCYQNLLQGCTSYSLFKQSGEGNKRIILLPVKQIAKTENTIKNNLWLTLASPDSPEACTSGDFKLAIQV